MTSKRQAKLSPSATATTTSPPHPDGVLAFHLGTSLNAIRPGSNLASGPCMHALEEPSSREQSLPRSEYRRYCNTASQALTISYRRCSTTRQILPSHLQFSIYRQLLVTRRKLYRAEQPWRITVVTTTLFVADAVLRPSHQMLHLQT
jgi:hypothetical protein